MTERDAGTIENETLVLDLAEWIATRPRSYADVMDAWRTSCPRFPIWEDVVDLKFVARAMEEGCGEMVHVTPTGRPSFSSRPRACMRT